MRFISAQSTGSASTLDMEALPKMVCSSKCPKWAQGPIVEVGPAEEKHGENAAGSLTSFAVAV